MAQMKMAVVVGAIGVSLAVAVARSQDAGSREPGLFPVDNRPAQRELEPTPAVPRDTFIPQGPVPAAELRSSAFDSPVGASEVAASDSTGAPIAKRPSAADRLKQIRGTSGTGTRAGAAVVGPVTANPADLLATPPQSNTSGKGTVSVLKKAEGGTADRPAERSTARRLLRTPSRSSQAQAPQAASPPAATSPEPRTTASSNSDSSTLATSQGPTLRVESTGPATLVVGKEALYTVTVYNEGQVAANDILVRASLPSTVRVSTDGTAPEANPNGPNGPEQRLGWTIPQLDAKASERFILRVTPLENRPVELAVDWAVRPQPAVAQIQVLQPQLELAVSGPRDVLYGETAVYTIRISNPGTGDAEDVSVEFGYADLRLEPKRLPTLAAGQEIELKVEFNANQAGPIQVLATATGSSGLRADANQDVIVRRAKLEVEVTGEPVKFAGSMAIYQLRVRNTGDAPASDVVASIKTPAGAEAKIAGDAAKTFSDGLQVDIGTLAPNAERTMELQCVLMTAGENEISVETTGANELAASDAFVTRVEALAELKLSVNDPSGPVAVGKEALYEVHIVNRGTKAATKIHVVAQFSQGIEPIAATGGQAEVVPGQVLFQVIPRIEPGQEVTLIVKARADSEGNKRFRAEVTSEESDTQLVAQETTYFYTDAGSKAR